MNLLVVMFHYPVMHNVQGSESEELAAASRLEDDVNFYQTVNSDVAKLFHIDTDAKRPALILVKKEEEKLSHFGLFNSSSLVFVSSCYVFSFLVNNDVFSLCVSRWQI